MFLTDEQTEAPQSSSPSITTASVLNTATSRYDKAPCLSRDLGAKAFGCGVEWVVLLTLGWKGAGQTQSQPTRTAQRGDEQRMVPGVMTCKVGHFRNNWEGFPGGGYRRVYAARREPGGGAESHPRRWVMLETTTVTGQGRRGRALNSGTSSLPGLLYREEESVFWVCT